jgi:hypothetical protein
VRHKKLILALAACVLVGGGTICLSKEARISPEARLVAIRRAQVWAPTRVASMNITAGPQGRDGFAPGQTVTCDFRDRTMNGRSPKFTCVLSGGDEVKVKYGKENGEVYGEVAASRLLWALGFGADRMYPVKVICRGCPSDPAKGTSDPKPTVVFDPAVIERDMAGLVLESGSERGWAWPDLDMVEETAGGAPPAQRDALKLLAALIQHTDNKAEQQRLLCAPGERVDDQGEPCLHTFMMISDLGLTFGHANVFNRNQVGSVNFEQWSRARVWSNPKECVASLSQSQTGTLVNPRISEAGRKFLADLLVQLTDAQIRELFTVSRVVDRAGSSIPRTSVDDWVGAFKAKREAVVSHTCPDR